MTVKIKFDGVTEHDVPQAVADHITSLNSKVTELNVKADGFEHKSKELQAKVDGIPALVEAEVVKLKADAEAFTDLVKLAIENGVKTDGLDAKGVKVAFIKEVTGRDVSTKDDAYINTAFDFAKDGDLNSRQREEIGSPIIKGDGAFESNALPNPQDRFKPKPAKK